MTATVTVELVGGPRDGFRLEVPVEWDLIALPPANRPSFAESPRLGRRVPSDSSVYRRRVGD